jgi:hypothetical protein
VQADVGGLAAETQAEPGSRDHDALMLLAMLAAEEGAVSGG